MDGNQNNNSSEEYIYVEPVQQPQIQKFEIKDVPLVTFTIVLINILVFLFVNVGHSDDVINRLIKYGGAYTPFIGEGQYYRLFTCMFLHSGFEHLFNNMLCLAVFGNIIEKIWGRWRFLGLYITGGLVSSVVEYNYNLAYSPNVVSIGASGAVYATIAGVAILAIMNVDMRRRINPVTLLIVAIAGMADGFFSLDNIGNAAHIGGFAAGIVITFVVENISCIWRK